MGRFELFEHTADIGLRAYGKDLNETFAHAARAVFHFIVSGTGFHLFLYLS